MNYVIFFLNAQQWLRWSGCLKTETFVEFLEGTELISSIVKGTFSPTLDNIHLFLYSLRLYVFFTSQCVFKKHFPFTFYGIIRKQLGGGVEGLCLSQKVVLRAPWEPGQAGDDSAKAETGNLGLPAYSSSVSTFSHRRSSNLLVSSDSLPPSLFPLSQPNANPHSPVKTFNGLHRRSSLSPPIKVRLQAPVRGPSKPTCMDVHFQPAWVAGTTFTLSPETTKENHTD